jgi:molecular chaperone GrpE
MFQRTILRQRRAVQSALSVRPISSPSLSARQPSPLQQLSRSIRQSPFRPVPRYYSTENDAAKKAENEGAAAPEGNGATEAAESAEDALKKELEAKNKEVIDMKV